MIFNMDCLKGLKNIPDKSVDLFICDLPYGETSCVWDTIIPMDEFWKQFKRIRKSDRVACIHFCSTKFGYSLIKSWEKGYKMDMVWKKRNKTGGLCAKYRPLRNHEMVYFFYDKCPKYNRDKYHKRLLNNRKIVPDDTAVWGVKYGDGLTLKDTIQSGATFDPLLPTSVMETIEETVNEIPKEKDNRIDDNGKSPHGWDIEHMDKARTPHFDPSLPVSVLIEEEPVTLYESNKIFFKRNHQTEKPLDILEFFLKYYTDEGDTVLDPTMGSGSTGVACNNTKRNFIGFELSESIFLTAKTRISKDNYENNSNIGL